MFYGAAAIGTGVGAAWRLLPEIDFRTNLKKKSAFSYEDIMGRPTITLNFACKNCVCEVCRD